MKRKHILALISLIMVFVLALTSCGKDNAANDSETADQAWGLSDWELGATAWSSNNGATVTLTAIPNHYNKNVEAFFVIRMEGEEVESIPCQWEEDHYTATVDLNAADGYCYYLVMRDEDGAQAEFEVNTPGNPSNGKLINMEHSLEAYCHMSVNTFSLDGSKLTITDSATEIRLPLITRNGEDVVCDSAVLILTSGSTELARQELTLPQSQAEGVYEPDVNGTVFQIPELEEGQQLSITLEVTLGDGQVLSALGGTWLYSDGQMTLAVG